MKKKIVSETVFISSVVLTEKQQFFGLLDNTFDK